VIGLYLHVPYCTVRCSYSDFYLVPARGHDLGAYARALRAEIASVGAAVAGPEGPLQADTLHLGGGTPSLLPAQDLESILAAARSAFRLTAGAEVALEANPEDLTAARAAAWRRAGINRLTVGVQSLQDRLLLLLRRPHDAAGAMEAIGQGRRAGFTSLGADLMLGLPGEDAGEAIAGIDALVAAGVDHLSVYLLEVHDRTRLARALALRRSVLPPPDRVADLYESTADRLEAHGFEHYEISNFARPGHRSRHNLKYWTDQDYIGFGPSAHSYLGGERTANGPNLSEYLACGGRGIPRGVEPPSPGKRALEALLAGLRLLEGVDLGSLRRRHGDAIPRPGDPNVIDLVQAGFLVSEGERLRLTRRGRLVSNEVLEHLMDLS
jgi:oxygen-independent coproporphyrinogen-3 oxidase